VHDLTFHVLADQEGVAARPQAGAVELDDVAVVIERLEDAHFLRTVMETPVRCMHPVPVVATTVSLQGVSSGGFLNESRA